MTAELPKGILSADPQPEPVENVSPYADAREYGERIKGWPQKQLLRTLAQQEKLEASERWLALDEETRAALLRKAQELRSLIK